MKKAKASGGMTPSQLITKQIAELAVPALSRIM